jgi:NADPH-ferrihemoprotein reductase
MLTQFLPYVMNPSQRQWLLDVISPTDKYIAYKLEIESACRSTADVISNSLSSLHIPLADLLHILPAMQPRYYTISSSSSCFPNSIHVTVSVTEFTNKEGKVFKGLCSSYMQVSLHTDCRDSNSPVLALGRL